MATRLIQVAEAADLVAPERRESARPRVASEERAMTSASSLVGQQHSAQRAEEEAARPPAEREETLRLARMLVQQTRHQVQAQQTRAQAVAQE